tara:strand:- start:231 stop:947 length:717 start_codon:yes stop_codon:yes gene_type:complete
MLVKEFNKDTKTFFAVECQKRLYKKISKYQKIEIYASKYFGNILLLQDCFMLTEKNSNQYKETCINIIRKKKLDNILIIGGGDYEIAHHLFENKIIKKLSIVEIDYDVVKSCNKYFPLNHKLKKNEKNKINLIIDDGYKWLKEYTGSLFDLIIIDCTDPDTSAGILYSSKFYKIVNERLKRKGIFIQQSGSPLLHEKNLIKPIRKKLEICSFDNIKTVKFPMPIYPSGTWSFIHCKKA